MHRHGYKGRKFNRERDQRRALIKGLAESFVRDESIETTLPKAKELVPYIEKLITRAKKGDLHNRRQVIRKLQTVGSAHKLIDEIAPQLKNRNSGHLKIARTNVRRGDNAPLARISFVDQLSQSESPAVNQTSESQQTKASVKETAQAKSSPIRPTKAKLTNTRGSKT